MKASETINFLKELQKELQTQDKDYQAAPRFWVIADYAMIPVPEGFNDSYYVNIPDEEEACDMNNYLKNIKKMSPEEFKELGENALEEFEEIDCEFSALEWVQKYYDEDAYLVPVSEEHIIKKNTMFLTKQDAKNHIKSNQHHYSNKVHTYAMTAWRSPTVAKLLNVLENTNWDD